MRHPLCAGYNPGVARSLSVVAILSSHTLAYALSLEVVGQWGGQADTNGTILAVVISGGYAFLADQEMGLQIIDVRDVRHPVFVGRYKTEDRALSLTVAGSLAFVADSASGVHIIDVSNPRDPQLVGLADCKAFDVAVEGHYLYVATGVGLDVFDVQDPTRPNRTGRVNLGASFLYHVAVSGGLAYLTNYTSGVVVVDATDSSHPRRLGEFATGVAWDVAVTGSTAYVATGAGPVFLDVSNPATPKRLSGYSVPGEAFGIAVSGTFVYVAIFDGGLDVFDVTNIRAPQLVAEYHSAGLDLGLDVAVSEGFAFLATGWTGLVIFTAHQVGTVKGMVVDAASLTGIGGAAVFVYPNGLATTTAQSGSFSITGIDPRTDYRLEVIAPGYVAKFLDHVVIAEGTTDLGTIALMRNDGPFVLRPLVPNVNPLISQIEEGGVAYRYYRLFHASDHKAASGVPVRVVHHTSDTEVPQDGIVRPGWAGAIAGLSDGETGVVRVGVPSTYVGDVGAGRLFDVVVDDTVRSTFQVQVVPRTYEHLWVQESKGGLHGRINLFKGARGDVEMGHRAKVTHTFRGDVVAETVAREHANRIEVGPEVSFPIGASGRFLGAKGGAFAGVRSGLYLEALREFTYDFDPYESDASPLRFYSLYFDLETLVPTMGPFVAHVQEKLDALLFPAVERSIGSAVEAGGFVSAEATLGGRLTRELSVGLTGAFEFQGGLRGAVRQVVTDDQVDMVEFELGGITDTSFDIGLGISFRPSAPRGRTAFFKTMMDNLRITIDSGIGGPLEFRTNEEWFVTIAAQPGFEYPSEVRLTRRLGCDRNVCPGIFEKLDGLLHEDETLISVEFVLSRSIQSQEDWRQMSEGPGLLKSLYTGAAFILDSAFALELVDVLFPEKDYASPARYSIRVEPMATGSAADIGGSLHFIAGGGFDARFDQQKGRSVIVERGVIVDGNLYPLESTAGLVGVPQNPKSILQLQAEWFGQMASVWADAVSPVVEQVEAGAATVIGVANDLGAAAFEIAEGALEAGTTVTLESWLPADPGEPRNDGAVPNVATTHQLAHFRYGISGIFRLSANTQLKGAATVNLGYNDENVEGLDEYRLRLYRFDEVEGKWRLVGGEVNPLKNQIVATISELGIYALAPPLPAGELLFQVSPNVVPAGGTAIVTAIAPDMRLGSGDPIGDGELFTVAATGMGIVSEDVDPDLGGTQVASANGGIAVQFVAPAFGGEGTFLVKSVHGDASGTGSVRFVDSTAPPAVSGFRVTEGQSRLWVSWDAIAPPTDVSFYRVYYSRGHAPPPFDGSAGVDGLPSPVSARENSTVLRGLEVGATYFVAVSAIDRVGNESPLSTIVSATTVDTPPSSPTNVRSDVGEQGERIVVWNLSEDDGFGDRDVVAYSIARRDRKRGTRTPLGDVPDGTGTVVDVAPIGDSTQVSYEVAAIDASGFRSVASGELAVADLDSSGRIDLEDFAIFQRCIGLSRLMPKSQLECSGTDFNSDRRTGLADATILLSDLRGP